MFFSRRVSDGKLIGCVKLHHSLNEELKNGGHIAYGIRPSERGRGYGIKQLKLILGFAKQEGLTQVIVACDKDNIASAKTAIGCGGISVKEFPLSSPSIINFKLPFFIFIITNTSLLLLVKFVFLF